MSSIFQNPSIFLYTAFIAILDSTDTTINLSRNNVLCRSRFPSLGNLKSLTSSPPSPRTSSKTEIFVTCSSPLLSTLKAAIAAKSRFCVPWVGPRSRCTGWRRSSPATVWVLMLFLLRCRLWVRFWELFFAGIPSSPLSFCSGFSFPFLFSSPFRSGRRRVRSPFIFRWFARDRCWAPSRSSDWCSAVWLHSTCSSRCSSIVLVWWCGLWPWPYWAFHRCW